MGITDFQEPTGQAPLTNGELSYGQKLVGITFNPSQDSKVQRAKELCALLADLVKDCKNNQEQSDLDDLLKNGAIQRILDAQMWAVKYITNRH